MKSKNNQPFLFLTAGICLALLLPALFMNGMFMDGTLYASVSKNFAEGYGTFWNPFFSATIKSNFHEQPPLFFFLEGLFFKIIGNGFYTERIYSLLAFFLNALLLHRCWKIISPNGKIGWLPILLWFTMPVTFYAFTNNLEENTMSVFVLAAMIHLLNALHLKQKINSNLLLAGIFILLAGLTKGIQGLFLLGTPFFWWIIFRKENFSKCITQSMLVVIPTALFVLFAWMNTTAHESFAAYFYTRFHNTFNHVYDTSTSRFHLLFELLIDSLFMIAVVIAILLSRVKRKIEKKNENNSQKLILFFLVTAASGIFPLLVTMEQRGFYLVTALPYLALAAACMIAPEILVLQEKLIQRKKLSSAIQYAGIGIIILTLVATFIFFGQPKRDAEKINDLDQIAAITGERVSLLTSTDICCDWSFLTYAMRFHGLSFAAEFDKNLKWFVLWKNDAPPGGFQLVSLPTTKYSLYKKQ